MIQETARHIFTVTTGRSGTNLLAKALNTCDEVRADHEPDPILNGRAMRWLMCQRPGSQLFIHYKAHCIRRMLRQSGARLYGDISHVFSKYAVQLLDLLGPEKCVIIKLTRDPTEVVKSFASLGGIPGEAWGTHWLGNPAWPAMMLKMQPTNQYEALAWHVFETEVRWAELRRRLPEACYLELDFEELTQPDHCVDWLRQNGFKPGADTVEAVTEKVNTKSSQKRMLVDEVAVARAVEKYRLISKSLIEVAGQSVDG